MTWDAGAAGNIVIPTPESACYRDDSGQLQTTYPDTQSRDSETCPADRTRQTHHPLQQQGVRYDDSPSPEQWVLGQLLPTQDD
ncbi:hypothetical protein YH66_09605 [[Brevibacterium] flavum]|uniref:Uncharacterized protein n=1 Tax=[Brevibacterium] flavum TaxID=92706 RepID=A0A0F6WQU0_9CORY|nr:hypothetical protein YH66_09605 [[Brevibacterium] flavum]